MERDELMVDGNPLVQFVHEQMRTERTSQQDNDSELITGLSSSARALSIAEKYYTLQKQMLVVTPTMSDAHQLASDLAVFVGADSIYLFPVNDLFHAQMAVSSPEAQVERVQTLYHLLSKHLGIVITTVAGLRKLIAPKDLFAHHCLTISSDMGIDLKELTNQLIAMGYRREQLVASPGEFSIRGGIIDIFPVAESTPIRLELFGDEIDSMRYFDPETQRSLKRANNFLILPYTDLLISKEERQRAIELFNALAKRLSEIEDKDDRLYWETQLTHWQTLLAEGNGIDELQSLTSVFYDQPASLLHYLDDDAVLIFDEYVHLKEQSQKMDRDKEEWLSEKPLHQVIEEDRGLIHSWEDLVKAPQLPCIYYSLFHRGLGHLNFDRLSDYTERSASQLFGQLEMLGEELKRYKKKGYTVVFMAQSEKRMSEMQRTFQDYQLPKPLTVGEQIITGEIQILPYTVQSGFEWTDLKLAVLTEKELFNQVKKNRPYRKQLSNAERLKDYTDLKIGDYVVHIHHGIGRYLGMETLKFSGVHQDYLTIAYRNDDKVYVPVDQLHLVQKYVSSEGKTPIIHKLGGTRWAKTKARVTRQVEDIADELLDIYAERESRDGFAYPPVDAYYYEFENDFPYTETPDQKRSIQEMNDDLSKKQPMDRLLVGDVGYGKTEVAMRGAFRVVQAGRQVVFLVPTTILAQQHYNTFRERFEGYPVEIEVLSRFKTPRESQAILERLAKGQIDIIIGTHRLLSKDVHYKNLGFLVIDEEQRFGVKHKELIKKIKAEVDVLTLTATPIPRTLHMSIVGARDLSLIETPPANRFPVQTHVLEMSDVIIREAIEREIDRGGQVFYLHNRVDTIEKRVHDLEQLVPDARIAYAHGQMSEVQLENILYAFIRHEYDVLVTTTIIETGVDIPNVNTLLIENADRMGLSQLYQLRGRVGRSHRLAYAYMMYEPNKLLTEESEKRLKAIQDFTELGSGFKIAMRDLSIRGAGNLLGSQQSGFIDSVGFDLYSQMLAEAVAGKEGKSVSQKIASELDLSVDAYIPDQYIPDESQKIDIYKKVHALESDEDYIELQEELIDRFGDYPDEVSLLLQIGRLKMYSDRALIEKISDNKRTVDLIFSRKANERIPMPEIFKALQGIELKVNISADEQLNLHFYLSDQPSMEKLLNDLIKFAQRIAEFLKGENGADHR